MTYKRVTGEERRLISWWRREGCGVREIARRLRRCAGSISRERVRNLGKKGYRPKQAHWKAQERAKRRLPRRCVWTPEIIGGRARMEGRAWVCKETIYAHIYADAKAGGDLWRHLPRAHRKRRRRCPRDDGRGRGRIPNQRMIETRPAEVETRRTAGHWEGDLINGAAKTGNVVTAVERKTRFTLLGRVETKEARDVTAILDAMFRQVPVVARESITLDNGKEVAHHKRLARLTGMDVFFARRYHAWERASNENVNGLIRRVHPKGASFADIDPVALERLDRYVNDRPRKCRGWRTPREALFAFLACAP